MSATDGSIETRKIIGHAALAANNKLNGDHIERVAALLTGDSRTDWPASRMYTTGVDCYTGERLVVGQQTAKKIISPWHMVQRQVVRYRELLGQHY